MGHVRVEVQLLGVHPVLGLAQLLLHLQPVVEQLAREGRADNHPADRDQQQRIEGESSIGEEQRPPDREFDPLLGAFVAGARAAAQGQHVAPGAQVVQQDLVGRYLVPEVVVEGELVGDLARVGRVVGLQHDLDVLVFVGQRDLVPLFGRNDIAAGRDPGDVQAGGDLLAREGLGPEEADAVDAAEEQVAVVCPERGAREVVRLEAVLRIVDREGEGLRIEAYDPLARAGPNVPLCIFLDRLDLVVSHSVPDRDRTEPELRRIVPVEQIQSGIGANIDPLPAVGEDVPDVAVGQLRGGQGVQRHDGVVPEQDAVDAVAAVSDPQRGVPRVHLEGHDDASFRQGRVDGGQASKTGVPCSNDSP